MNNYDLVIVAHEKDFNNIKIIVEYASKNLNFDSLHLILSERQEYKDMDLLKKMIKNPIHKHKESDILNINKDRIKFRPNWIYQMLLKMFQNVTLNDNFLIIEADCIILKNIDFFRNDKTLFYLGRDQNTKPYYDFSEKILGIGREYNHSFISEFMMYDKKIIRDMLIKSNCNNIEDFLELIYKHVDGNCFPADYELYGNFCYKYHKEKIEMVKLSFNMFGRDGRNNPIWNETEIRNIIKHNLDKDAISFHLWGLN